MGINASFGKSLQRRNGEGGRAGKNESHKKSEVKKTEVRRNRRQVKQRKELLLLHSGS